MTANYADFTEQEFEDRYAKTRALMADQNLDAMLITERLNYQYYTGHRSEQCAVDKIRSYMFILPKDGHPTLITMPFEVAQVEQTSFIKDIRTTGGLMGHPEFVSNVLKGFGPGPAPESGLNWDASNIWVSVILGSRRLWGICPRRSLLMRLPLS